MGLLDSVGPASKEATDALSFTMEDEVKLAADGVPFLESPKKIANYPIVQDAGVIERQTLYLA